MRPSIDETMMNIAHELAKRGTCMRSQVGCVVTDVHGHILSTGYNGQPRKHMHCNTDHPCPAAKDPSLSCSAIHAETNALLQCPDVNKIDKIYITREPCEKCRLLMCNTSVNAIIFMDDYGSIVCLKVIVRVMP